MNYYALKRNRLQVQYASVEIVDKYDPNDVATGTIIVIELSTSLDHT